jgi:uncharacterized DUF497 family protein
MPAFQFGVKKSNSNTRKHGIDFEQAQGLARRAPGAVRR